MFPFKSKLPCLNNNFENTKCLKNSSSNLRKLLQEAESDNQKEIFIDTNFNIKSEADLCADEESDYIDVPITEDIKERKRLSFLEQKRRQQLRENTEELKELEMKLRAAYISKGLAAQISERQLQKVKEKEKQNFEYELMERDRMAQEKKEKLGQELDKHKKLKLMTELKEQIEQNDHKKSLKMEEYMEEKKTVDNIAQKILIEQHEEQKSKIEKRIKIQKDAEEFFRVRQILKAVNESVDTEENKKIENLQKERDEIAKKEKEDKLSKLLEREQISENIGKKLDVEKREKHKRMDVLEDLLIEEKTAHDDEAERRENAKSLKKQIEHRLGLFTLIENNKRRAKEQEEEDRLYRKNLLEELSKKDELNRLEEEKKKQKMLEYKRAIRDDLDFKVKFRATELTELLNQRENDIRESQRKQQLIEEERIKMLQEHAVSLQGFLPSGVLRKSDKEFLSLPTQGNNK